MIQRYAILSEDGALSRIVGCPPDDIEAQLQPGETYRNLRKADTDRIARIQAGKAPTKAERLAADIARVRELTGRKIEAAFPLYAQLNAMREGNSDDPRFAEVDALRAWSNAVEAKLRAGENIDALIQGVE